MHRSMTLRAVRLLAHTQVEGCVIEFGVYRGHGLMLLAQALAEHGCTRPLYGFDTFEGMPPSQVTVGDESDYAWAPGTFADTSIEAVQALIDQYGVEATLVKGVFDPNVPLSAQGIEKVALVHIDCDIFEGYRDALALLTPHLQPGMILLCDDSEPVANPDFFDGVRRHGQRALHEWWREHDVPLLFIRHMWSVGLYVVVDRDYLEEYGSYITLELMPDTLEEHLLPELRHSLVNCTTSPVNLRPRLRRRLIQLKGSIDYILSRLDAEGNGQR